MNRRSRMLEALGVSTEWTLRGAAPAGLEAVEVAAAGAEEAAGAAGAAAHA